MKTGRFCPYGAIFAAKNSRLRPVRGSSDTAALPYKAIFMG
jgi:hypothetical protein